MEPLSARFSLFAKDMSARGCFDVNTCSNFDKNVNRSVDPRGKWYPMAADPGVSVGSRGKVWVCLSLRALPD